MSMDIKEIDTLTALSSGLKQQMEEIVYILSNPDQLDSKDDFVIVLRKSMDFIVNESTRDMIGQMALIIQYSDISPDQLKVFKKTWAYLINQVMVQGDFMITEHLGLKFASLSYKKGQRPKAKPINLTKYALGED